MLTFGVVVLGVTDPDDPDFVVLADPEGNRFYIADLDHEYA